MLRWAVHEGVVVFGAYNALLARQTRVHGPSDAGSKRNLGHSQCADPRLRFTGAPGTAWRNCSGGAPAGTGGTAAAAAAPAAAIFTRMLATDTHQYIGCACKRARACARVCA